MCTHPSFDKFRFIRTAPSLYDVFFFIFAFPSLFYWKRKKHIWLAIRIHIWLSYHCLKGHFLFHFTPFPTQSFRVSLDECFYRSSFIGNSTISLWQETNCGSLLWLNVTRFIQFPLLLCSKVIYLFTPCMSVCVCEFRYMYVCENACVFIYLLISFRFPSVSEWDYVCPDSLIGLRMKCIRHP